ncbi:BCS1 N terminal-domain-containing protein [Chaetomium fimeti]|uniref:BCS1 N terminal-domain-containing protein n=1 Tax=Chaetomium fimeti TaxID=1854472 RepID=A0AAE0HA84_9PEZI|nr:BCS1 N terminal-domain-containing protein [Chaetomium fimeti]
METFPPSPDGGEELGTGVPQNYLLDLFFPGFSVFSSALNKYLHIDLNLYIPLVLLFGGLTFTWRYFSEYFSDLAESHLMSRCDVRVDDEIFNYLMAWVSNQRFAQGARRFVVNTNLNSRSWYLWRSFDDDEEGEEGEEGGAMGQKKKALAYTPTFGSHWFIYKGHILSFRRTQNQQQSAFMTASEREEISISCFGRNPTILKELLHEARDAFLKKDEAKTAIYRGTSKAGSSEPQWQRCMSRTSRPFSTVILNDQLKQDLIDDVTDYLNPTTRRWYANRGIPYRRGYLLYGPPGTGKSSLSLALAGFFKMRIYIVSLSSVTANEENLATLFAELPRRCVVLLEDIDTAGLTHTREDGTQAPVAPANADGDEAPNPRPAQPGQPAVPNPNASGRLSLSGLLNILDGVASQEGRVLIMTTNHMEKLDKALIRPGRVDMIVKFDRADASMTSQIFKAIYAPLEGDDAPVPGSSSSSPAAGGTGTGTGADATPSTSRALFQLERSIKAAVPRLTPEEERKREAAVAEAARKKAETTARVGVLAGEFAAKIPAHEFSPAEIQGFLLKNKRHPEKAVAGAEEWVAATRKEKKEKELKEAEEKREAEKKEKEEAEKKKKEEAEEKEKEKEKKEKKGGKKKRASKKSSRKSKSKEAAGSGADEGSASDPSSSEAESESSESEREEKKSSKKKRKSPAADPSATPAAAPAAPPAATADVAVAPVELEKKDASDSKVEPVVVVPTITVDTVKAKEAAELPLRTPGADSGYGTPSEASADRVVEAR